MTYWVQIDTTDNSIKGVACFADPADRTLFDDAPNNLEHRPQNATGLSGAPPEDLYVDPPMDLTFNYQWNGTDDIELIP